MPKDCDVFFPYWLLYRDDQSFVSASSETSLEENNRSHINIRLCLRRLLAQTSQRLLVVLKLRGRVWVVIWTTVTKHNAYLVFLCEKGELFLAWLGFMWLRVSYYWQHRQSNKACSLVQNLCWLLQIFFTLYCFLKYKLLNEDSADRAKQQLESSNSKLLPSFI